MVRLFVFQEDKPDQLIVTVTVPRGTRVEVNDIVGKATIGNTEGELRFSSAGYTDSTIGNVAAANVSLAGSGKVLVGNVAGDLKAETAGSGDIQVGNTGPSTPKSPARARYRWGISMAR